MRILQLPALTICLYLVSCSANKKLATSDDIKIQPRSAWQANEPRPYKQHVPVQITVHHEGTKLLETDDAAKKIKNIQVWGMGKDRNWADIPYHFLIAPDGTIFQGRDVLTVGETATEYDPTGHLLIVCLGNLEIQEPPQAQLTSLINLIALNTKKYDLPLEKLATHRDHSAQTTCPGKNLYKYFQSGFIMEEVRKKIILLR